MLNREKVQEENIVTIFLTREGRRKRKKIPHENLCLCFINFNLCRCYIFCLHIRRKRETKCFIFMIQGICSSHEVL